MTKQHHIHIDIEIRRFQNRVRQQRCRARKREEKAKMDAYVGRGNYNAECRDKTLCMDLMISGAPGMANWIPAVGSVVGYLDAETHQAKNMIRQQASADDCGERAKRFADFADGNAKKCHEAETEWKRFAILGLPCMIGSFSSMGCHQSPADAVSLQAADIANSSCNRGFSVKSQKIPHHLLQIEDSRGLNALCRRQCASILNDAMARRLKNRERQRRYRARKRQEVDMKNSNMRNQPNLLHTQWQSTEFIPAAFVHCHRDWKKDARMAYRSKQLENASPGGSVPDHVLHAQMKAESPLEGDSKSEHEGNIIAFETNEATPGRRNWKTAARNKDRIGGFPR